MYKFFERNKKKFLAIFAVGLMIVFILPAPDGSMAGGRETAFRIGDETVSLAEARQANDDFEAIQGYAFLILAGLGGDEVGMPPGAISPLLESLADSSELFLLLQKEALRHGLRAPKDQVDRYARELAQIGMDPARAERGVRGLLLIRALASRATSGIKASEAQVTHELAKVGQRVKLDLVHFATEDFAQDIPAPTAEQLQKHFEQFKDQLPGSPGEQNPFGFGYLVPSQVKLNYLTVPAEEVAEQVRGKRGDPAKGIKHDPTYFAWMEKAQLHFRANPERYPATQPATQPSTGASTQPADAAAATKPATGPAARALTPEVEAQIIEELIEPEVERRAEQIANAVAQRMESDFQAVRRKSPGAPEDFGSPAYLQRVKDEIAEKHGVQLGVSEINEPKSQAGLREIEGIGQSFLGGESFPQYVMRRAEPFVPAAEKGAEDVLSLNEPSRPFQDVDGNRYVVLIREATPAEPADLSAVKEKVEADLRTKLAFEAATAAAKKLEAAARSEGLAAAAKAVGKDVFTTPGFFDRQGMTGGDIASPEQEPEPVTLLPGVELPPAARGEVVDSAYELLERATPDKAHPSEVVSLPAAGRVVVAQLADVERLWPDDEAELVRAEMARRLAGDRAGRVLEEYFKPAAVKQRLDYRNPNDAPPPPETAAAS